MKFDVASRRLASFDHVHELGQDPLSRSVGIDSDRRQRDHLELSFRDVVKTDDGDVVRYSPPGFGKGAKHTHRHVVVRGEDGGDLLASGQLLTLLVSRASRPIAEENRRYAAP